jgi:hypothetical protein
MPVAESERMLSPRQTALVATLVGLVAAPAAAQDLIPGCTVGRPAPAAGQTVPANAPALSFFPPFRFDGGPIAEPDLELLDAAGTSLSISHSTVTGLVRPAAPLAANATYRWRYKDACTGTTARGDFHVEATFSTSGPHPLPTTSGTLTIRRPYRGILNRISGDVVYSYDVTALPVTLVPSTDLEPFEAVTSAPDVSIDGKSGYDDFQILAGDVQVARPILLLLPCGTSGRTGYGAPTLEPGRHTVSVTASIAGGNTLMAARGTVSLACVTTPAVADVLAPGDEALSPLPSPGGCALGGRGRGGGLILAVAIALARRTRHP